MSFIIPAGAIRKKRIVNAFIDAGAVSVDTAKTLKEVGVFKGLGVKFDQLVERGVIVSCEDDKYYVDKNKL